MFQSNEQAILEYKNVLFIWLFQLPFFLGGVPIKGKSNLHSPPYPLSSYLQFTDFHKNPIAVFLFPFVV